jgi:hypothetical protein
MNEKIYSLKKSKNSHMQLETHHYKGQPTDGLADALNSLSFFLKLQFADKSQCRCLVTISEIQNQRKFVQFGILIYEYYTQSLTHDIEFGIE